MQFVERKYHGYHIATLARFSNVSDRSLVEKLKLPTIATTKALGGRGSVAYSELEGVGRVIIKHYNRGGILGAFLRNIHLRIGKVRAQSEFEMLLHVQELGINAPEPIAFLSKGWLLCSAWLITREIEKQKTLADLSLHDEDRAREAMREVVRQVNLLMQHNIVHVDLHPGNVLVDENNRVFLLDFDKSTVSNLSRDKLRDNYVFRWRRAVIKHNLPAILSETISLGLRTAVES